MSSVLHKAIVLSLNKSWQPIGMLTVGEAVTAMSGGSNGHPAFALDVDFSRNEAGELDTSKLSTATPTSWEDWMNLPIRDHDLVIETSRGPIRVPTVLIQQNYNKMPTKRPRLCNRAIWDRDKGICQVSGRKLKPEEGNIDHVIPKARGGRDAWENMVTMDRKINSQKGHRLNEEAGLRLIRAPKAPADMPVSATIKEIRHPHWTPFLIAK